MQRYKVEPYVVCADVYGAAPHTGQRRLDVVYRLGELALPRCRRNDSGFQLRGHALRVAPCVPPSWPGFELSYRHQSARYRIVVDNSAGTGRGVRWIELDGQRLPSDTLPLGDDVKTHNVRVQLG